MTIWKFRLRLTNGPQSIPMPLGSRIVHTGMQRPEEICLWAICSEPLPDPPTDEHMRTFEIFGTGHETRGDYVGTVFSDPFVWHVFEV